MTEETFVKFLNDHGCAFETTKAGPRMALIPDLRVFPLKKEVGVHFRSDSFLTETECIKGPWLLERLLGYFTSKAEINVRPVCSKKRPQPRGESSKHDEGYFAEVIIPDLSFSENPENDEQIKKFGEELSWFICDTFKNKGNAEKDLATYNEDHLDFVTAYAARRLETGEALSPEELKTKKIDAGMQASLSKTKEPEFPPIATLSKKITDLLVVNFNVILTGAPGTGKTYAAKKVATDISKDEWDSEKGKWKHGRIASVQFHPGYDYSDFVIGMKPVLICGGKEVFRDTDGLYTKKDESKEEYDKENIEHRLAKDSETKVSFRWKDGIFKKFADKAKGDLDNKYVFLIDEINRADLSRVFGELFSLLEEEYRYPNGKGSDFILLPNGERFSIPKNLYIIGTMNDIDRSVESMDFALRRRFAWYEVTADMSEGILDAVDENGIRKVSKPDSDLLKKAMEKLNAIIGGKEFEVTDENGSSQNCKLRLGSEYQLGGAIFAKLEKYVKRDSTRSPQKADEVAFDKLWNNHIENILLEYLRGQSNRTALLKGLKQVFDDAVKGIDKQGESGQTGDSATVDKNSATDSE